MVLNWGPFREVNKVQFYLLSLFGSPNTVKLPRADLDPKVEMGPRVDSNSLLIELFGLNCAQMAPKGAESDFGLQGIGTLGLKQIFLIFGVHGVGKIQVSQSENQGLLQTKHKVY